MSNFPRRGGVYKNEVGGRVVELFDIMCLCMDRSLTGSRRTLQLSLPPDFVL